jgi:hypothetical protein
MNKEDHDVFVLLECERVAGSTRWFRLTWKSSATNTDWGSRFRTAGEDGEDQLSILAAFTDLRYGQFRG